MKRRHPRIELTDDQHLFLAILLVILVAVSMLYCLGLGGLMLRDTWQQTLPLIDGTEVPVEELPVAPTLLAPPVTSPTLP
ncbi:MAG: hypothetical protein ACK2UC_05100 [Anaerolineae bacterium]